MSKIWLGSLIGGLILFVWQFLSWSLLNIHGNEMQYSPNQDQVLEVLNEHLEEGNYFMPGAPPGSSAEEHQQLMEESIGKPWASIQYHKSLNNNMGMNMFRGFVADFVAVLLLCWMLMKMPGVSAGQIVISSLSVGLIGFLTVSYLNSIWFETPTVGALIDVVVQWGLCGVWLSWWLRRGKVAK